MTKYTQNIRTQTSVFADIDEARLIAYGRHLRSVEILHFLKLSFNWFRGLVNRNAGGCQSGPKRC
ncbi:MAG: hypothetical protein ACRBC3_11295 [Burkholderiaceae bacterium]